MAKQHWEYVKSGAVIVSNTPEQLWEQATDYFMWCDLNPIEITEIIKTGKAAGMTMVQKKSRPYNIKALCIRCGILEGYIKDILSMKNEENPYYRVMTTIMYVIYIQNYEMAMIGEYSPVFTSKVLNVEADEAPVNNVKIEIVGGLPKLAQSENEILENMMVEKSLDKISIEQSRKT